MEPCSEAVRLRDIYIAALNAFQDAQTLIPSGIRPGDPEFQSAIKKRDEAHMDLLRVRREYWNHIRHGEQAHLDAGGEQEGLPHIFTNPDSVG